VNFKGRQRKGKNKIANDNLSSNKTHESSLEEEDATGNPMTQWR